MSRFRKNERRTVPVLNTASLPDLIFTLLFFFMLVINMRAVPTLTRTQLPTASELQKLKEKSLLIYIVVGWEGNNDPDKIPTVQLNSELITLEEIPLKLKIAKENLKPEDRDKIVAVLRMDKNTPMGLVNDIRQNLRETYLQTVYYAVEKE